LCLCRSTRSIGVNFEHRTADLDVVSFLEEETGDHSFVRGPDRSLSLVGLDDNDDLINTDSLADFWMT